ncbi:E3 ubiquitin-protein ligase TRIM39-like [Brienomyrus brachyistius]|uniref:E3 ubiquitin-protein ligase TRIM39-like n=1 Tax=Brienomyrus brachyistius TaxID=42636 RepID=UPI0020B46055|nr:E3 ubiquitin-protein ligase TRIM39-like [Brienomyrus brachyistius]
MQPRPQIVSQLPRPPYTGTLFGTSSGMEKRNSASMSSFLSEEQFLCSICLDVFTTPVSTPCGHSFCMACISSYWDKERFYQCPICKEAFGQRPELHVNSTLREITEQFKRMLGPDMGMVAGQRGGVPERRPPMQAELSSDLLAEMKARFQKFSQTAGDAHTQAPPPVSRRLSLGSPAVSTEVSICYRHNQRLDAFCRTDQVCICAVCMENEHRMHSVVPAKRECLIKKSQLGILDVELRDMIQSRLKKVENFRMSLASLQATAKQETAGSMHMITTLISSLEKAQATLLENVEMERLAAERHAGSLIHDLELEIAELKKRSMSIKEISQSEDEVLFLKTFPALCTPVQTKEWGSATVSSDLQSAAAVHQVSQLVECFQREMTKLMNTNEATETDSSSPAGLMRYQPKMKRVEEYAVDVTLDPNTAHPRLIISEDSKRVRCGDRHQLVPDTPQRFDRVVCVLARQGFTAGRHYWEVEVGLKTDWDVGVASCSGNRKGKITVSPSQGYWFLSLRDRQDYSFRTDPPTNLGLSTKPHKIGVFLDYDVGQISFYNADIKSHIYTFIDTFSDTIYPFFSPCTNKSSKNDAPLTLSPITLLD